MKAKQLPKSAYKLTPNLAYILGVIEGDGNITGYQIQLGAKDVDFVQTFKRKLECWSGMTCRTIENWSNADLFYTYLNSINAINFLKAFDIFKLSLATKNCKVMFLRGMYDSEGGAYKGNRTRFISIANNNKELLQLCTQLLNDLGIKSRPLRLVKAKGTPSVIGDNSFRYNHNLFSFYICGRTNITKFSKLVGFSIKRKQQSLMNLVSSYDWKRKSYEWEQKKEV